jgi:hypothetical protein
LVRKGTFLFCFDRSRNLDKRLPCRYALGLNRYGVRFRRVPALSVSETLNRLSTPPFPCCNKSNFIRQKKEKNMNAKRAVFALAVATFGVVLILHLSPARTATAAAPQNNQNDQNNQGKGACTGWAGLRPHSSPPPRQRCSTSLLSSAGRPRCQSPSNRATNLNNCMRGYARCPDEELVRFGKAARSLCRDPRCPETFKRQLEEARAEWRRRHRKAH